jgi:hypothetical protein
VQGAAWARLQGVQDVPLLQVRLLLLPAVLVLLLVLLLCLYGGNLKTRHCCYCRRYTLLLLSGGIQSRGWLRSAAPGLASGLLTASSAALQAEVGVRQDQLCLRAQPGV